MISIPILFEIFRIALSSTEPEKFKTEKLKQDQYICVTNWACHIYTRNKSSVKACPPPNYKFCCGKRIIP